jgi:hypothetical protein
MTNRVTKQDLANVLDRINAAAGQNPAPWTRDRCENGRWTANVGTYTLDWAYGGVRLVQIVTDGGGERDITPRGTKRECLQMMRAFEAGLEARS